MSDRLSTTLPSGVYRTQRTEGIVDAAHGRGFHVARVVLERDATKARLLNALAGALKFPDWFGGNWDALEECLSDLGWLSGGGVCVLIENTAALPRADLDILCSVLEDVAAGWRDAGRPFYAVLVPGIGTLPDLDGARA